MGELLLVALLCEGHVLLEDVPGTGKTMLARAIAVSLGGSFKRLQCAPVLLPNDVTGVSVFNQQTGAFEFRPGPVFVNILLVDEINRATLRTQSALLEAMQEQQVTVDGVTRPLPRPFLVVATQNPIEYDGTLPLPETARRLPFYSALGRFWCWLTGWLGGMRQGFNATVGTGLERLRRGDEAGMGRRPSQTPYAYSQSLTKSLEALAQPDASRPEIEQSIQELTENFVQARYSARPVTSLDASLAQRCWERIRRLFPRGKGRNPG